MAGAVSAVVAAADSDSDAAGSGWKAYLRAKAQSCFDYLGTKEYELEEYGKTPKQIKDSRRIRLRGYVAVSILGLGTMHWGGAEKVLEHMSKGDKELANICVRFLIFAFNCSLVGLTAGTFPSTAPWALFFAGLGAWQSSLFLLALFHLETSKYHVEQHHSTYSFCISAFIFSLYWSHAAQDPLPLHAIGRMVVSTTLYLVYVIRSIYMCKSNVGNWIWKVLSYSPNPRNVLPRFGNNRRRDS